MPTIAGLLEKGISAADASDGWARAWERLGRAAAALAGSASPSQRDGPVAVLHDGSLDALIVQLAAIICGRDVLPVSCARALADLAPRPAVVCAASGSVAPQDTAPEADLIAFPDLLAFPDPWPFSGEPARQAEGALVLTSGPAGVTRVGASSLALSVARLGEAVGASAGDVVSTPMRLGEGLGLVFALLAWSAGARLVLPAGGELLDWARLCARSKVTLAAVGPADLEELAPALKDITQALDLSMLRTVLVGSYPAPVTADQLRAFNDAAMESSFDELALCPGYGTAGDTLLWSMMSADRLWRSAMVSREALSAGRWRPLLTDGGREIVSCGRALPGARMRAGDGGLNGAVGPIGVRQEGGKEPWQETGDEGCVSDGELFITRRGAAA